MGLFDAVKVSLNPFKGGLSGTERLSSLLDPADYAGVRKEIEAKKQVRDAKRAEAAAKREAGMATAAEALRRKRAGRAATLLSSGFDSSTGQATGYNQTTLLGG